MSQSSKRARRQRRRDYVQDRLHRSGTTWRDYRWLKSLSRQIRGRQ